MLFSQKLKKVMKEKNLTTYKIQKATGISQGNVDSWLKGRSKPREANLSKLCSYLDVPIEYFTDSPNSLTSSPSIHQRITKKQESALRMSICDLVTSRVPSTDLVVLERIVKSFTE
ncbi:MAG: helix-turn-helix transcriptional regulator [Bacillota bacterium]|nr:helix-turn-helix transcriptional regulator [Bacillota bacterium]